MAKRINFVLIGLFFCMLNLTVLAQNKWQRDSTKHEVMVNTAYYGPLVHPGLHLGIELPLFVEKKTFNTFSFLEKFGLEKLARPKTTIKQVSFEPQILFYNQRFNCASLMLGAALHKRIVKESKVFFMYGLDFGRNFQFYKDAIIFDERNKPIEKKMITNGYNQLGTILEIGYIFNRRKNQTIYYRFHAGILLPYNHLFNNYIHHEMGFRLISLN